MPTARHPGALWSWQRTPGKESSAHASVPILRPEPPPQLVQFLFQLFARQLRLSVVRPGVSGPAQR
jgi:hypothetical protein